jgi:hypothetical protein
MLPFSMIAGGTFTLSAQDLTTGIDLICQSQKPPDYVLLRSIGDVATSGWGEANNAQVIEWWWERSMGQGTAKGILQSSAAANAPALTSALLTAGGITTYDTANPPVFANLASTAVTGNAGTFVVSMANTGDISVGDYVRLYNQAGEQQISGYTFQVTAVTANTSITLGYMASSGMTFAADATTGFVKKFIPNRMYPRKRFIANITQATQATIFFTETNDFTPGEIVGLRIPFISGAEPTMIEANNLDVRVLSVTNSATVSSIVVDLDTTGFTAFAFATSATAAAGVSPSMVVPSASGVVPFAGSATIPQEPPGTNLLDSFDNRNVQVIHLGTGLFNVASFTSEENDKWLWQAYKYDSYNQF